MADKTDLRKMVMGLHIPELQKVLGLLKLSKYGKKSELMGRLLVALGHGISKAVQSEIESLYRQRYNMMSYIAKSAHIANGIDDLSYAAADAFKSYNSSVGGVIPQINSQLPIHPDVKFKSLPFYEHVALLLKPATLVPRTASVSQEAIFVFHLTPQQANQIVAKNCNGSEVAQIQLRFCWLETSCEQEDNFPPNLAVRINNRVVQLPNPLPSNKQGVDPKRPPQPLNITSLCKINAVYKNQIVVTWASEYGRNYCVTVNLVIALNSKILLSKLKQNGIRHQFHTRALIKEKLALDVDSEIATTSLRISLLCPLGKMRMTIPCRASTCNHLQCFDAPTFLQMNEKKPTWMCPVCDKPAEFQSLIIDGLFTEILQKASKANEIQFTEDGEWQPMNSKDDECWVWDSPATVESVAVVESTSSSNLELIDLTETDDESDSSNPPSAQPSSLASSPPYTSIMPSENFRHASCQDYDRDSPIVISLDSPPLRSRTRTDSFFYKDPYTSMPPLPKPPPAHSKISVSSYSSAFHPNFSEAVAPIPLSVLYNGSTLLDHELYNNGALPESEFLNPLSLAALRPPAHSNNRPKSNLSLFP